MTKGPLQRGSHRKKCLQTSTRRYKILKGASWKYYFVRFLNTHKSRYTKSLSNIFFIFHLHLKGKCQRWSLKFWGSLNSNKMFKISLMYLGARASSFVCNREFLLKSVKNYSKLITREVFGIAEQEYDVQNCIRCTRRPRRPGWRVISGKFCQISFKMILNS